MAMYSQNRQTLKNRKVSNAVCEVEGCSNKATFGERSDVHGLPEPVRCKGHKDNFSHFTRLKWTFEATVKLVVFVGAVMTSPETVRLWAFDKVNQNTRIPLTCPDHHRPYDQALQELMVGKNGCGECTGNLPWSERVPELVKKIEKRGYTLDETEASLKKGLGKDRCDYKLKLICPFEHVHYSCTVGSFTGKQQCGCSTCAGNLPWSKRVPELMDIINGREYTLDETQETEASLKRGLEKKGAFYKLKLICPNGHAYYSCNVDSFTGKNQAGCSTCYGNVPWSKRVPELMDIISGREYTLDESQETEASLKKGLEKDRQKYKLKLICPNGHKYSSGNVNHFTGKRQQGCSTCTDPRTEKLAREWLDEQFSDKFRKVKPDFLFYPETGRNLELDLFCLEWKVAFEIDGAQHNEYFPGHFHRIREKENNTFDNTNLWRGYQIRPGEPQNDRLFIHQQNKDRFKDKKCEEEGIYLIRIDGRYYNYMDPEKLIAHLEEQLKKFMDVRGYVYEEA